MNGTTQQPQPKLEKVYNHLKKKNKVKAATYQEFEKSMEDSAKLEKVFNYLKSTNSVKSNNVEEFSLAMGLKKKDDSFPGSSTSQESQTGFAPALASESQLPVQQPQEEQPGVPLGPEGVGLMSPDQQRNELEQAALKFGKMASQTEGERQNEQAFQQREADQIKAEIVGGGEYVSPEEESARMDPMENIRKTGWNVISSQIPSAFAGLTAISNQRAAGRTLDPEKKKEYIAMQKSALKTAQELQDRGVKITQNTISSIDKIKDPWDAFMWGLNAVTQAGVQIPLSVGTGGASSLIQETGSIYLDSVKRIAQEKGITPDEVIDQGLDEPGAAIAYGAAAALLDRFGAGKVMGAKEAFTQSIRSRAKALLAAGAVEGHTEYTQTWLEQLGARQGKGFSEALKEVASSDALRKERIEAWAQGLVGGAGLSSTAGPEFTPDQKIMEKIDVQPKPKADEKEKGQEEVLETPPVKEESKVAPQPVKTKEEVAPEEKVQPVSKLGTGANVYFKTDKHRVNDLKGGKVVLNVGSKEGEIPVANVEFDNAEDAVKIAERVNKDFPQGIPDTILADKYIEGLKKELLQPKVQEDAVQEREAEKVSVEVPPGDSKAVVEGATEQPAVEEKSDTKKEVVSTDEKTKPEPAGEVQREQQQLPKNKKEKSIPKQEAQEPAEVKEKPSLASNVKKKYAKVEPLDVKTALQRYFATGGTVSSEEAKHRTGFGYKDLRFFTSEKGRTYDDLVQMVRENLNRTDEDLSEDEVLAAVDDIITSGRKPVFDDLRKRLKEQEGDYDDVSEIINESASLSDETQDAIFNDEEAGEDFTANYLDTAAEEAVDEIIDRFSDDKGNTDWDGIQKALDNPFSPEAERMDPLTKDVYEKLKQRAEGKSISKPTTEKSEERDTTKVVEEKPAEEKQPEVKFDRKAEVEKAQANLEEKKKDLNRIRADYEKSKKAYTERFKENQGDMFRGTQAQSMFDDRKEMTENLNKKGDDVSAAMDEVDKAQKELETVGQLEITTDEKEAETKPAAAEPAATGKAKQGEVAEELATPSGAGRGDESGGATSGTGLRTRPALVYATKEYITPPTTVSPATYNGQIDEHQALSINMAINRFDSGGEGFLLADGTGVGKTRQIIGIADQRSKKGNVLIVTENETIIEDAFKKDAKAMGVSLDKIELGTYRSLADGKIGQGQYDTVIYDEAHNLKNADAAKTRAHSKVKAKHKVYATATPMDKHSGAAYFISNVLNISEKEAYAMMGLNVDYKEAPPGSGNFVKAVTLQKGMTPAMINNNILRIRDDMMKIGSMIRREYPFYGNISETVIPATDQLSEEQSQIEDYWDSEIEEAFESGNPRKAGNLIGQKILESGRWNERFKVEYAYNKLKEHLKKGNQVIIVAETVNEVTIKGLANQKFPGTLSSLSEQLEKDGIPHARIFGDKPKINEVKKFQDGEVKIALMTPQSGGTGINLDDVVGNAPRRMIVVTPNFSGDKFQQVIGRVSRRNTKSPAEVELVYTKSNTDAHRKKTVDGKLTVLRAIQSGKLVEEEMNMEGLDKTGDPKNTDTTKPIQTTIIEISPVAIGVAGDTYPIKDKLRMAGGRWVAKYKAWSFPKSQEAQIRTMLESINGKNPQAQHAANRWDGRSIKQIQQASQPLTKVGLNKLVERLKKKFKGISDVVVDKKKFTKAWEEYLKNGGEILLQETSQFNTRDGVPIGYSYDTDQLARERFNIPKLEKIGSGSDRDVFDLGDGRVLKVAKSPRGLEQNIYEGDHMLTGIIPEVHERGVNYVVTEKVGQAIGKTISGGYELKEVDGKWGIYASGTNILQGDKQYDNYEDAKSAMTSIEDRESEFEIGPARNKLNTMLRELKQFSQKDFDNHTGDLQTALEKWELSDILNYNVLWGDFTARRNWGFNKDGNPIHLDGGTFGGVQMIERYRGKTNLSDPEFRDIYNKSRQLKKEFKDKDKFTMFQAPTPGGLPNGFIYKDKIYINPEVARLDTPIHEFGHLWVETLKNSEYHKPLYRMMLMAVKDSPYHKEVINNPNYVHLTDAQSLDEALATGIGERGARLASQTTWQRLWSEFVDFLRSALGLKKTVNFDTFTVNDYMDIAAHELLSAGEIGSITSFHLPETMTFRLKHYNLPADAWARWKQRVVFEQVREANPEGWSHTILGQSEQMMSEFMQLVQDKTRYIKMTQESIVDFYTDKTVEKIQQDPTMNDAQKKKAIKFTKENKKAIREAVLGDDFDIHGQLDLASGKVKTRFDEIRDKWLGKPTAEEGFGPMMRFLTLNTDWKGRVKVDKESYGYKLAQAGINPLDLGTYAAVKHIPERNAHYRTKDPNTPYQSGVTDQQAEEYLKIFQQDPKKLAILEEAYKAFRKDFIEAPLKAQLDAGLINQEQFESLSGGFNGTYVPWKVSEFQSIAKSAKYTGNMSSGAYNKIKSLTPRGNQYGFDQRVNPFIAAMTAYEETLANIEKNKMLNNLADLIKLHPDKNYWEVKHIPYKVEMDVATGRVNHTLLIPESEAAKIRANGIKFMKNGKPRWVLIHDEYLSKSLKGMRSEKPNMASRFFLNMMRNVMNYMRLTQTALNIDFIFTNPLRDIQDAGINIQEYETKGLARSIIKGLIPSIKTIYEYEHGTMDPNTKSGKYLMEMKEAGGEIAWLNFEGVEEISQDVYKEIENYNETKKKASAQAIFFPLRAVMKSVVMSNKIMEQHIRFSTYVALREKGFSEQKAALGAKNVTINFNKRGEQKLLSSLYLYINPAIQGQVRNMTAIARSKTVRKMLVGYMIGNIINRALLDAFDDDEDKDWKLKDKLNDNDHSNNIILFNFLDPSKPLKIPLSYNLKPWKALSDATYEVATDQKNLGQATTKVLKNFAESLVPMSGSYFIPTIAELPVEVSTGIDTFTGRSFVPTDDISKKDSELYYSNTSPTAVKIARAMGEWNEGTDDLFEIHPGTIDHVMDWGMGGMKSYMRTPEEMIRVINSDSEDKLKELDINKIAVIRRFVTDLDKQPSRDKDKYYRDFETLMKNPTTKAKYEEYVKIVKNLVDKGIIKSTVARRKLKDIRKQQKERWNITLDRIVVLKGVPLDLDQEDE